MTTRRERQRAPLLYAPLTPMDSFASLLRIVAQRSLANWRLLATVIFGMVLAAALMSSVILYSDAVRDLGLSFTLRQQEPLDLDLK
ncbi:MAG: hypothetical protein F4152_07150, partial [Dehalococcoidia bacterium]|nr:hypothetical protein [Dehalococcoidia bacterium]